MVPGALFNQFTRWGSFCPFPPPPWIPGIGPEALNLVKEELKMLGGVGRVKAPLGYRGGGPGFCGGWEIVDQLICGRPGFALWPRPSQLSANESNL